MVSPIIYFLQRIGRYESFGAKVAKVKVFRKVKI
jgi:hypothetical protein